MVLSGDLKSSPTLLWGRCIGAQEWTERIYTVEYDSAFKKQEILQYLTTWDIMLSEISPSQKDKHGVIPFI